MGVLLIAAVTAISVGIGVAAGVSSMVVAHACGLDMEITAEAVTWTTGIVVIAALASVVF
jgi:hypothetical protein